MNIAYADAGRPRPAGRRLLLRRRQEATSRDAYEAHIAKVLELSGVAGRRRRQAGQGRDGVRDAPGQGVEVERGTVARRLAVLQPGHAGRRRQADAELLVDASSSSRRASRRRRCSRWRCRPSTRKSSKMLADVPVDALAEPTCASTPSTSASPYLRDAFVAGELQLLRQDAARPEGAASRAGSACWPRSTARPAKRWASCTCKVAFPAESKARMEELVKNLRDALKVRIENLAWMSAETKKKALEKWATFTPKIGYPGQVARLGRPEPPAATATSATCWPPTSSTTSARLGKIGKPVDKTEWGMTPQTVNAYYNPLQNEIVFPAAILQPPFFDPKADDATQLRRHRRGDRPRDDPRLRRPGQPLRADRQLRELVDRRPTRRASRPAPTSWSSSSTTTRPRRA